VTPEINRFSFEKYIYIYTSKYHSILCISGLKIRVTDRSAAYLWREKRGGALFYIVNIRRNTFIIYVF
jgi:hypothetical protein